MFLIQSLFKMRCHDFKRNYFDPISSEYKYFQNKCVLATVVMEADPVVITHKYAPKRYTSDCHNREKV